MNGIAALPSNIIKRNGAKVPFDLSRVERAVTLCYSSFDEDDQRPSTPVPNLVGAISNAIAAKYADEIPTVENVQDIVEMMLQAAGEYEAAKRYIIYRSEHARKRVVVPSEVQEAFDIDAGYFPAEMQRFMFYDKYSRFNWDWMRRETWPETVDRGINYLIKLSGGKLDLSVYERIRRSILRMESMPSMRLLAMAGPAAERNSMSIYNCSYLPLDCIDALTEIMLISLAGCGVGYSVERRYVEEFPRVLRQNKDELIDQHIVDDSAEGWAESLRLGLNAWINGHDINFDYSLIRPAGTPLKTKGGRASGPGPLKEVHRFCRAMILSRQGRFLSTVDVHDMACVIGGAAVSGGVRRTALIALFDYDDSDMRTCKSGSKLDQNPHRWNANNSAVWPDEVTQLELIKQFTEMDESQRGEPGIFSRRNANETKPSRRARAAFGSNPCGEINLRPMEFCNLTIAVARHDDTYETLKNKVEIATIIGTIQSLATKFPGMRPQWKENCEDERLLGVDINGERDCPLISEPNLIAQTVLEDLRKHAVKVNKVIAAQLGINPSAAITCNKPNGNSSQLLDCSSGINDRFAPFYIRNVRVNTYTPVFRVLQACGVPMDPENGQTAETANTWVVHFPMKSPEGTKTRRDHSAIDQCNFWLMNKLAWTEHNPSITVNYHPDELLSVMEWVWDNRTEIGGMAFLPIDDAQYDQMPYEEITEEEYEKAVAAFPSINWALLYAYEHTDMTEAAQTLACMAGACDVDLS